MGDPLDALVSAADDGSVSLDGLRVTHRDDGYRLETPDSSHDGLSESPLRDALAAADEYVTNWYFWTHIVGESSPQRRAFLRWVEGADGDSNQSVPERYDALRDGLSREWGQLLVTATLGDDGERVYELRHADEAHRERDGLDTYHEPLAARQLATYDEKGRYRPLKTGTNLAGGWVFPDLDGRDLVETVETFYPASVPNWYREREGTLDVEHWVDTIGRQTGMYSVIETWNRGDGYEHVNWVAEACCTDSQCVKRREWQYDDETDLDVDGGDGAFPCREPCSLVIAASRKWTRLEGENTQTYEFELTPSEKEQLEAIIDAVADDRTDEIREADVYEGANRYRARFLRAKLFDDDGNLCGVPTEEES
ncbi:DR2241 family protein [Haloferax sp. S1W]|uniref:DR2241 family protein n=1 Tax=Haloferax sp. S1W TaxID=3377110 RepID=UPI0037C5C947